MFKYELNQLVYYMKNNAVHSSKILSRRVVENAHQASAYDPDSRHLYAMWGETTIEYRTVHGVYKENLIYASKEDLAAALIR